MFLIETKLYKLVKSKRTVKMKGCIASMRQAVLHLNT